MVKHQVIDRQPELPGYGIPVVIKVAELIKELPRLDDVLFCTGGTLVIG